MSNPGAFILKKNFLTESELNDEIVFALSQYKYKNRTHAEGSKYGNIDWFRVVLDGDNSALKKMLHYFKLNHNDITMAVIYYLEPGAQIHPHRDLTGASVNERIRFHLPLVTSQKVTFSVNGEDNIFMAPGELWVLDTSYQHAVKNEGEESRIHIVLEAKLNSYIKKMLPTGYKSKLHTIEFFIWGIYKTVAAILINSWKDPAYARVQLKMACSYAVKKIFRRY